MTVIPIDKKSNAELDRLAEASDRQRGLKFRFRLLSDLGEDAPAKAWLIKNIIALNETSAWIAPPGAMKSALLCELAFAIASKADWHGYKAKGTGAVVYFALERSDLVKRRMQAYLARAGEETDAPPIAVIPATVDLMNQATVKDVVASIRAVEDATGEKVVFAIFDTFAKLIAAGGGDEDKARDQGRVFVNVQRIKDEIGCAVGLVGHTGKNEERGSRGSNAILGDVDVMVTISVNGEVRTVTIAKANDAPEGVLFSFKSENHSFGTDEDGDPITVNVVSSEPVDAIPSSLKEPKLKPNQQTVFAILHGAGSAGLTLEGWNAQAKDAGIGTNRKADLFDIRKALLSKGLIRNYGDRWHVVHESGTGSS
jgi:AAA domain